MSKKRDWDRASGALLPTGRLRALRTA
jgi:hypothetical protein